MSGHVHDESCGHGHACVHDERAGELGVIHVDSARHDEAAVISGTLTVLGEYAVIRAVLERGLAAIGREITASGGIIGHIKAACAVTETEMFSLTDASVSVRRALEPKVAINVAAIVFAVPDETVKRLVLAALEGILKEIR